MPLTVEAASAVAEEFDISAWIGDDQDGMKKKKDPPG